MKGCELCVRVARVYCESDQASLCWECDEKVHGANFLVARHARVLLCRSCQSSTPWRAAGVRLSPTVSLCDSCAAIGKAASLGKEEGGVEGGGVDGDRAVQDNGGDDVDVYDHVDNRTDEEEEEGQGEEEEEEEEEEDEEEEEGENQVVPGAQVTPPPASSSSGEESSTPGMASSTFLKRMRENADLGPEADIFLGNEQPCPSSHRRDFTPLTDQDTFTVSACFRPFKGSRRSIVHTDASTSLADHGSVSRICVRRAPAAVDLVSSASSNPPI